MLIPETVSAQTKLPGPGVGYVTTEFYSRRLRGATKSVGCHFSWCSPEQIGKFLLLKKNRLW